MAKSLKAYTGLGFYGVSAPEVKGLVSEVRHDITQGLK